MLFTTNALSSRTWLTVALLFTTHFFATSIAAQAEDSFRWTFSEGNDPDNKGRATAYLIYGEVETDNQLVSAICEARGSTADTTSTIILGADTGNLKNGDSIKIRFSGGGKEREIDGEVIGVDNTEEAISGAVIRPKNDDTLWQDIIAQDIIEYNIPGYRSSTLNIKAGREKIKSFFETCKSYAKVTQATSSSDDDASASEDTDTSVQTDTATNSTNAVSEKEAFDQAKDLGTIEGWEAFLNLYSKGFRADLARAYVKRLANGSAKSPETTQPSSRSDAPAEPLSTIDPGPGTSPWVTGKKRLVTNNNKAYYSASVRSKGIELVTYCVDWNKTGGVGQGIFAVLKESPPGSYPDYQNRINAGLAAAPTFQGNEKQIRLIFSSGLEDTDVTLRKSAQNGELMLGTAGQALSQGQAFLSMMTEDEMTVSAPPFSTTIQLTGSKAAICRMADRCGASLAGCGTSERVTPTTSRKALPKKKTTVKKKKPKKKLARTKFDARKGCRRGTRYIGGRCRNARSASEYCGPGYAPRNGKCTQGASYNF